MITMVGQAIELLIIAVMAYLGWLIMAWLAGDPFEHFKKSPWKRRVVQGFALVFSVALVSFVFLLVLAASYRP